MFIRAWNHESWEGGAGHTAGDVNVAGFRTSVKRSAVAVAILNATVSTYVNFSRKRYWMGLNVMQRMNKGCKNSGTVHWTKTRKKQCQLQELYVGAVHTRKANFSSDAPTGRGNAAPNRDSQNGFRQRNRVIRYRDCCKFGQLSIVISPLQQLMRWKRGFKIKKRSFVEQAPMV
ncbi:hypothetical protein B0H14DRAFT_2627049 [Mycena olivaceomarginata]|nr:hypothetical protein B0H14DRAFT_2627049 [Mycena olivaceomarginata]